MIRIRKGRVKDILCKNDRVSIVEVFYDGINERAVNYNFLTGNIEIGDSVYINTSATYLGLSSGGYSFVIINESRGSSLDMEHAGHIMKLRYTPYQIKCLCASEEGNKCFDSIKGFKSLEGMPVICGELHSMLSPTACTIKLLNRKLKIVYIMSDGGALPIDFSTSVRQLKSKHIIDGTITYGNAFGGDLEAVNIYDALIMCKAVFKCDTAIVTMGPGIAGTGTKYGFSGIEQGYIIDAVNNLEGAPIVIPRISFSDSRERHMGISHHTLTVLSCIARSKSTVVIPVLGQEKMDYINRQIKKNRLIHRHHIIYNKSHAVFKGEKYFNMKWTTMGRDTKGDREFFLSCSSAAALTVSYLRNRFFLNL